MTAASTRSRVAGSIRSRRPMRVFDTVSPWLSRAVVERCQEHGVLPLPGAVTATEIQAALELGLTTVKFFPAGTSGGAAAIAALAAPSAA